MFKLNKNNQVIIPKATKLQRLDFTKDTPKGYIKAWYASNGAMLIVENALASTLEGEASQLAKAIPDNLHLAEGLPTVEATDNAVRVGYYDGKDTVKGFAPILTNGARVNPLYTNIIYKADILKQKDKNSPIFILNKQEQVLAVLMPLLTK